MEPLIMDDAFSPPAGPRLPAAWLVFLSPFAPPAWRAAAQRSVAIALLQLILWVSLFAWLAPGVYRPLLFPDDWEAAAVEFDANYDPIVLEQGEVRVEGPRVFHSVTGRQTFLVDPDETVPLSAIQTSEAIVIRRTELIRRRPFRTETTPIGELQTLFGVPDLRVDGASIQRFGEQWGTAVRFGLAAAAYAMVWFADLLFVLIYALAAAGVITASGRASFAPSLRACVAAGSSTLLPGALLRFAGFGALPCCMGLVVWPAWIGLAGAWAVGTRGGETAA